MTRSPLVRSAAEPATAASARRSRRVLRLTGATPLTDSRMSSGMVHTVASTSQPLMSAIAMSDPNRVTTLPGMDANAMKERETVRTSVTRTDSRSPGRRGGPPIPSGAMMRSRACTRRSCSLTAAPTLVCIRAVWAAARTT